MPSPRQVRAGAAYVELTARDTKLVRGLQKASKRLKSFASRLQSAGTRIAKIGTAAAAPFALSAKIFANFEQQMARVKALTGATSAEFQQLENLAKTMGRTTVFSASQAAEAMSYFALAGFETSQIMGALGPTLNLAAAGQIEIAEAADIAAKIMSGMGLSADELGNAIDVMAKAMTTANTDLTMLGDAFKFVGPMAKTAGVSLEEITAAIQLLSNAGIQGEMAGTTLRGMLLSLTSPSVAAQKELDRLGVKIIDGEGNFRGLAAVIGDMERALAGVGSGEKLRSLGTIFPARQAAGAAELISQGAGKLKDATAALGDVTGTASAIAGTQLDTLTGDFTILMSALEGVAIAIGEALGDALRTGIRTVTDVLAVLGQWISENRSVVLTVAGLVVGVTALGVAMMGAGIGLQVVAFALGGFATALAVASTVITAILSPIGLLVTAAVALGTYLLYASDVGTQALRWLRERFAILKNDALKSWGAIGAALASGDIALAGKVLWSLLKMEWSRGIAYLTQVWLEFKYAFTQIASDAAFGAARMITDATSSIESGWVETIGFLADAWSVFTNMLTQTWHTTVGFLRKAWVQLKSLFDEDIDVQAQLKSIDAETKAKNAESEQTMLERVGQRDQERRQRRAEIERERTGAQDALGQMQAAEQKQRDDRFAADLLANQNEVDAARKAWKQAIADAGKPAEAAEGEDLDASKKPQLSLPRIRSALMASRNRLANEQNNVESKGGFNAMALGGIGADSLTQRTAKASERIAVNTAALVDKAKQGRLVFTD